MVFTLLLTKRMNILHLLPSSLPLLLTLSVIIPLSSKTRYFRFTILKALANYHLPVTQDVATAIKSPSRDNGEMKLGSWFHFCIYLHNFNFEAGEL